LSLPTARILPVLYQGRAGISLYDAQWSNGQKVKIPDIVIKSVLQALKRFKRTCRDFKVPDGQIRVLATEATRVAINSAEYRAKIKAATGWEVEMLPKEDEGKTGAFGVASSFEFVRGIMMDLGGGSTQITWMIAKNGQIQMSPAGSVSLPYGAAALSRRLDEANEKKGNALFELRQEITNNLMKAVKMIEIPDELLKDEKSPTGLNLYLSGGGFRGWGFVLMSQHQVKPYPIPIINGFKTSIQQFNNTQLVTTVAEENDNIFRVSDRRANQVPAVALLVSCLTEVLPSVKMIQFAQGGVREGALFLKLSDEVKAQNPIDTATSKFATISAHTIFKLLLNAIPAKIENQVSGFGIHDNLIKAFSQSMYIHNTMNKDIQGASGLRSTTSGILGSIHGADHEGRAILAIMLCERWGGIGSLSPGDVDFYRRLIALLSPAEAWWAVYLGRVGAVIGEVYPAGVIEAKENLLEIKTEVKDSEDGHAKKHITVIVLSDSEINTSEGYLKAIKNVDKMGKKKNWPHGSGGLKVEVETMIKV
jgi:retrograde regulation protein 2